MTLTELELNNKIKQLEDDIKNLRKLLLAEMQSVEKERLKNRALCNKIAELKAQELTIFRV